MFLEICMQIHSVIFALSRQINHHYEKFSAYATAEGRYEDESHLHQLEGLTM